MTELEVAAFRRDCAALAGHVRAGLRGDGFGETARQALDKLVTLAYGAGGLGEEARAISAFSPEQRAELEKPIARASGEENAGEETPAPHTLSAAITSAAKRDAFEEIQTILVTARNETWEERARRALRLVTEYLTRPGLPAGRSERAGQAAGHCGVRACGTAAVCRCDCPQCDDARGGLL